MYKFLRSHENNRVGKMDWDPLLSLHVTYL